MTPTQAAGSPRDDARSTPHGAPAANHGASVSDPRTAAVAALPETAAAQEPLFTVTRGNPGPEELAALTAVLTALPAPQEERPARPTRAPRPQSRRLRLGLRLRPGRGAWRWTQPER